VGSDVLAVKGVPDRRRGGGAAGGIQRLLDDALVPAVLPGLDRDAARHGRVAQLDLAGRRYVQRGDRQQRAEQPRDPSALAQRSLLSRTTSCFKASGASGPYRIHSVPFARDTSKSPVESNTSGAQIKGLQ